VDKKEYLKRLSEARASRLNVIIRAVNEKIEKENAGLREEFEEMFFDHLMEEARSIEEKYGDWPVFDMMEIDYDDPVLDIYSTPAEKRM